MITFKVCVSFLLKAMRYVSELQEAFVLFDKNRDGMITKEELGAVLYALGQRPTLCEIQSLIRSVDLDSKCGRL